MTNSLPRYLEMLNAANVPTDVAKMESKNVNGAPKMKTPAKLTTWPKGIPVIVTTITIRI